MLRLVFNVICIELQYMLVVNNRRDRDMTIIYIDGSTLECEEIEIHDKWIEVDGYRQVVLSEIEKIVS